MAKRFISTVIWDEDWFLEMPAEYKLFWFYILSNCDYGGLFKVNLRSFCSLNGVIIKQEDALKYFNNGKIRIRVLENQSVWFIEDFFAFQYGTTFNPENRVHDSIEKLYLKHGIKITSIRGLIDLKDRVKDKEKDKDKEKEKFKKVKGGFGGSQNIVGDFFSDEQDALRMSDGTYMKISEDQKKLIKERMLKPYEISKND